MTLGSILSQLADEAFVEQALLGLDDIVLLARLRNAADAANASLAEFTAQLVGRFLRAADAEAWLAVHTSASRARNPAAAALNSMLLSALSSSATS